MCIRVSASTTLVFVEFSMVNFVFPLCKTDSQTQAKAHTMAAFLKSSSPAALHSGDSRAVTKYQR